jgi:chitodextrinase
MGTAHNVGATFVDTQDPTTPSGLTFSGVSQTAVTMSWNASSDNVGVARYDLFRNGSPVGNTSNTSATFSGLTCGTMYTFAVRAVDASGRASGTAQLGVTTSACSGGGGGADTQAPSAPSGVSVSNVTATAATLSWSASTDNVGVTGYDMRVNGIGVAQTASTSYTFTGLTCNTVYQLGVQAFDAAGNRSVLVVRSVTTATCASGGDTTNPSAPGNVQQTAATGTSATISWTASTDNIGVANYEVLLGGVVVGTPNATTHTFTGLTCATTYTIGVAALDAAGNRSTTTPGSITTSACGGAGGGSDTEAPTMPANLAQTDVTPSSLTVAWEASTDDTGVTGYRVLLNGELMDTVTATSHTFQGLDCETDYVVGVQAADAAGNSSTIATTVASTGRCGAGKPATQISVTVTKSGGNLRVRGALNPPHPGHRVVITLFKKKNGLFRTIARKRPLLDVEGAFGTRFSRPGRGSCKVTARFPGDADHAAGSRSRTFTC